jgi:hypothetical protein
MRPLPALLTWLALLPAALTAAADAHAATGVIGHIPASLKTTAVDFYVNVTNTGSVDSDDVVLGFIVPPGAGVNGVPLQELFGFQRVFVPAGQTVTVYLGAQGVRFTQAGVDGVRRVLRGPRLRRLRRLGLKGLRDGGRAAAAAPTAAAPAAAARAATATATAVAATTAAAPPLCPLRRRELS